MKEINHRELWNTVLYGTQAAAVEAASKLHQLGEISDKTFQVFLLACIYQTKETRR